jgi:hypothetical protein
VPYDGVVGFRDDNQALRARIQALEAEKAKLGEDKRRLESALKERAVQGESAAPESAAPENVSKENGVKVLSLGAPIMDRVSKRNAQEQALKQKQHEAAAAQRAKVLRRLQSRSKRVQVQSASGSSVIRIEPPVLSDQLRLQLPWGFGFAFLNPGVFVMIGLGFVYGFYLDVGLSQALLASLMTWVFALALINVVYAKWKSPPFRLELTNKHFALYKRGKKPILFGTLGELEVDAPTPDPAELHRVRVSDGRGDEAIDYLCAEDVVSLNSAIRSARKPQKFKKTQRD